MSDNIDDLFVSLNVDLSGLDSGLSDAVGKVQKAGEEMAGAFGGAAGNIDSVDASLTKLGGSATAAGDGARQAAQGYLDLRPAIQGVGEAASQTGLSFEDLLKAGLSIAGIELTIRAIASAFKDLAEAAVSTFAQMERTTIALTALTGNAQRATDTVALLKLQALDQALSFPTLIEANQRVLALGFSARQASESMRAAADAAAATGLSFAQISPAMDRISQSGQVVGRQLATIGLTLQDLAKAAGTTTDNVRQMFKDMDPGDRLDLLIKALQKFQGTAQAVSKSLSGQFQNLKTEMTLALSGIGEALAPILNELMSLGGSTVVPAIEAMVAAFKDLAGALGPLVGGVLSKVVTGLSDMATVAAASVSELVSLGRAAAGLVDDVTHVDVTWKGLLDTLDTVNPFHIAATEIQLMRGQIDFWNQSALIMNQRFADVTDSLKKFIDKTTASSGLLAIRTEFEAQKKAVDSARQALDLVTEAYGKHMASAGQLATAQKELAKALAAVTGELVKHKDVQEITAKAAEHLAEALNKQIDKLIDMKAKTGDAAIGSGQLAKQQEVVNEMTVKVNAALEKLSSSHTTNAVKAKQNAEAHDALVQALGRLIGPVQQADFGIEIIAGSHRNAAAEAVLHAQKVTTLSNTWSTSSGVIAGAADAMANGITQSFGKIQTSGVAIQGTITGLDADFGRAMEDMLTGAERAVQGPKDLGEAMDQLIKSTNDFSMGALPKVVNGMPPVVDALDSASQAMTNLGTSSQATAAAIAQVAAAAASAAEQVQTLGQQLDSAMNAQPGQMSVSSGPGSTWDYGNAMHSAQFGSLVEMGGPAAMGNISNWSTSGTAGTPQELADLAAKNLASLIATQQSLMKSYQDLTHGTSTTATAVTTLGTAAATAAAQVAAATVTPDQTLIDLLTTLSANPDLQTAFQDLNSELQTARSLYDSGTISLATYQKAIDATTAAHDAWANTMTSATQQVAAAATSAATSIAAASKSLDTVAQTSLAVAAATVSGIKSLIDGPALGSQVANAPGVTAGVPGVRGFVPITSSDSGGGYSAVQQTPGGWQNMNITINAMPTVAEFGHQLMDFLRLQGVGV